ERLAPPARALDEGGADRLGRGPVDVEDDGMADTRTGGARVELLEPEAVGELVDDRAAERLAEVHDLAAGRARARIEAARGVARVGQADQAVADDEAQIAVHRRDIAGLRGRRGRGE